MFQRLLDTFRLGRLDRELDEEMRFHIDMRAAAYERDGLAPAEARRKALRRFGSPLLTRERVRDVRLLTWLDSVRQDVQLGLRLLRRSPALTVAAVLSLGLAIGATTGVFAVGDALMVLPLPVQRPDELIIPQWHSTEWPEIGIWGTSDNDDVWSFSYPMYEQFARTPGVDLAGVQDLDDGITVIRGEAGTAKGSLVTGNFFRVLGVAPAAGRLLVDADNSLASPPVIVLSHRFWQKAFGSDPGAVGSAMRVNGQTFTIVGVAPREFFGTLPGRWSDFYLPACWIAKLRPEFAAESPLTSDRFWWLQLVARPKPGTSLEALQATLGTQFAGLVKPRVTKPRQNGTFGLRPGARGFAFQQQDAFRPVVILAALVALVLMIACSNVANLLLARGAARSKEAAMRLALGAGRLRLVRQHLTESLMLAVISGAAGYLFARWFAQAIVSLAPERSSLVLDLGFSWRVLGFDLGISVLAGLLVGLAPAITLSRSSVANALRAGTTVRAGWKKHRVGVGRSLVAVQIALSLLVLVIAGLFVRSLGNLQAVPLGFNPEGVLLFSLDPTAAGYSPDQKVQATDRIANRLAQVPDIRAVTWSSFALVDNISWNTRVRVPGDPAEKRPPCNLLCVGPGFHRTLQIPLVAGRFFDQRDGPAAPKVAIVNQSFVAKYLGGAAPLGQTFTAKPDRDAVTFEIVGVVRDGTYARIRMPPSPVAYLPDVQHSIPMGPTFALKVAGGPGRVSAEINRIVHELEPTMPVSRVRTYAEQIGQQLAVERSLSLLSSAFGVVALLLAAIGLYGVVAFAVARRTAEMGVRLALGASRGAVLRLMLLDSAKVIVPGACVGMAAALAATRFVESILYGLKPTDPATIVAAMALLLAVAAIAVYIPARRAAGIDPVEALRCE